MNEPKISVIIPVRNEADKIEQCLKAVFSQSLKPYEVIVVDGNSTDGTIEKIKKFPVRLLHENYHNRAGACQVGIENAKGEYVAFTDADCIPDINWLDNLIKELGKGIAGVGGKIKDIGEGLWVKSINLTLATPISGAKSRLNKTGRFMKNLSVAGANGACRREDIFKIGGFNVKLSGGEDLELGKRLQQVGKLLYVPNAVVFHNHTRGLKEFIKHGYRYGGWRRECRVWDLQAVLPLIVPLLLLSLIFTHLVLPSITFLYLVIILIMGVRFAIQERNIKYIFSIPIVYIVEHFSYIIGFWKETIKPRRKGIPWK